MASWLIWAALIVPATAADGSPPRNGIHYQLGGIMSGPIDLEIDLDTGRARLEELDRTAPKRTSTTRMQRLARRDLNRLQRLAARAIEGGLESKACRAARARGVVLPPIMDTLTVMTITLDGHPHDAPVRSDCWSKATAAVQAAAYTTARRASPPR